MRIQEKAYELREQILEMVYTGKGGHIGGDFSVIDILTELYYDVMRVFPQQPDNPDRDRFVLSKGQSCCVVDMYCLKPLDTERILDVARRTKAIVTAEEHAPCGGLGSMVCQLLSGAEPKRVDCMTLPDAPAVSGNSAQVFAAYGLTAEGIAEKSRELLKLCSKERSQSDDKQN